MTNLLDDGERFAEFLALVLLPLLFFAGTVHAQPVEGVRAYLEGRITVDPEVDDTENYSGFELLVMQQEQGEPDTLGYAVTDRDGRFAMDITAAERGIYPILISRNGQVLTVSEFVVADGDSGQVRAVLPAQDLRVRSNENAAWLAYQNLMSQHNRTLFERLQDEVPDDEAFEEQINFTAQMLWDLQESFDGTVGAEVAAAESILLLEGWNDELVLERAESIAPDSPGYVEVARAVRRATARTAGQAEAIRRVGGLLERTDDAERRAALYAEMIQARLDSLQEEEARETLAELRTNHPESRWVEWGERAIYQFENLSPGMPAPSFSVSTRDGQTVSLEDFRGTLLLLEFTVPQSSVFQRELQMRQALYEAVEEQGFEILTVSLEPDDAINDALFIDRELPGLYAVVEDGFEGEMIQSYNVMSVPTRYLIDEDGNILRSYVGGTMMAIADDVVAHLGLGEVELSEEDGTEDQQ